MKKILILLSAIIIVAVLWLAPWQAKEQKVTASPSMPLGLKGEAQALVRQGSTFPAAEAGLGAYLRIPTLDMVKAGTAFDTIYRQGGNWVIGNIGVKIYPDWDIHSGKWLWPNPRVYIDSQGWIVSYLPNSDEYNAYLMTWASIDRQNPTIQAINTTTVEEALKKVVIAPRAQILTPSNLR